MVAQVEPGYLVNDLPSKSDPAPQVHISWILDCWLTTFSTCDTRTRPLTAAEAPKEPEDFSLVASDFQSKILPGITHWSHPRFFAYFPAITNFESILADMMATSVSNPGFNVSISSERGGEAFKLELRQSSRS